MALVHRAGDGAGHAETALETVLHLWFWWAVHDHAREGGDHLRALLPRLPADSPLVAHGRWLAAWLCAARDPGTAHHLLSLAWPAAVLAGRRRPPRPHRPCPRHPRVAAAGPRSGRRLLPPGG
ncbi:hypothetical protein O1L60_01015 [Streptomyces diastatochromogenes]|nr:hypothetical protein [Streptomyces diastatochromogenes]